MEARTAGSLPSYCVESPALSSVCPSTLSPAATVCKDDDVMSGKNAPEFKLSQCFGDCSPAEEATQGELRCHDRLCGITFTMLCIAGTRSPSAKKSHFIQVRSGTTVPVCPKERYQLKGTTFVQYASDPHHLTVQSYSRLWLLYIQMRVRLQCRHKHALGPHVSTRRRKKSGEAKAQIPCG